MVRNETAQPIVRTLLRHIDKGEPWVTEPSSAPAEHYTSANHLAREQERLFNVLPQVMALSGDVPEPGSFVTRDQFGFSVVVVRGDDGVVRALTNVCAHRGAEVVGDERGCRRRHACPYHAWTYDSAGTLVAVPDHGSFPGVSVPGPGLTELPTVEDHGMIWSVPSVVHNNLLSVPRLGPFGADLDDLDLGSYRHWRHHRFDQRLNWKLVIDTFLEPYHFATLHRTTVGPMFFPNLCLADRHGPHVRMIVPRRTIVELADQDPHTWDAVPHTALVYVLFPSTVVVMLVDHVEIWRVRPHPNGDPTWSIADLDFYVPAPDSGRPGADLDDAHWERNWRLTITTVEEEDFATMAGAQRGLGSGAIEALRFGANEPALSMFHRSIDEALSP